MPYVLSIQTTFINSEILFKGNYRMAENYGILDLTNIDTIEELYRIGAITNYGEITVRDRLFPDVAKRTIDHFFSKRRKKSTPVRCKFIGSR